MTLNDLMPNQSGVIVKLELDGIMKRRLIDMGVTEGAVLSMLRSAPLGDPVEYSILGYNLCLRRSESKKIHIERIG